MSIFITGFIVGGFISFLVCILSSVRYSERLIAKSKSRVSECIDGKFYTILPESEYCELMTQARKYSAMANKEAHWAGFYDKRPGPKVS